MYKNIFSSIDNKITKNNTELPEWSKEAIKEKINSINRSNSDLFKKEEKEIRKVEKIQNPLVEKILKRRENQNNNDKGLKK
ncbi:hypothetical protein FUSO7_12295 [Fusobacterium necrophorum BFTR-2]|nr:hypothetical protein FUSO7_12295 [Fusobacterium necrophorum BFTR-2]